MKTNVVIAIIAIIIAAVGGFFFFTADRAEAPENGSAANTTGQTSAGNETTEAVPSVSYFDNGFEPAELTISAGDSVTFVNESFQDMWPASAVHPVHTVYPGSDIDKCGTDEESTIFDACSGIAPGDNWAFTFTEVGEWRYHNHLNPRSTGTIIVQ